MRLKQPEILTQLRLVGAQFNLSMRGVRGIGIYFLLR
jgi:hypothetical protein